MKNYQNIRSLFIRIFHYEYWPFWLFYLPMYFYGIFLALRAWSPTYFTAANPAMKYGGAFNMSKSDILAGIKKEYVPIGMLLPAQEKNQLCEEDLQNAGLRFPIIAKPDVGERGRGVEIVTDFGNLETYLQKHTGDIILQEYVDLPMEWGILFYRLPGGSEEKITSMLIRDFLKVTGDGEKSLKELIDEEIRARSRKKYLYARFKNRLHEIPETGEAVLLEPVGNHCRGTRFLNGNHLINQDLLHTFSGISDSIPGFNYGRFDVRAESLEALYEGRDLKILELNGVNSEPGHIYDPAYCLIHAYRDIAKHMLIIFKISRLNRAQGIPYAAFPAFLKDLLHHIWRN